MVTRLAELLGTPAGEVRIRSDRRPPDADSVLELAGATIVVAWKSVGATAPKRSGIATRQGDGVNGRIMRYPAIVYSQLHVFANTFEISLDVWNQQVDREAEEAHFTFFFTYREEPSWILDLDTSSSEPRPFEPASILSDARAYAERAYCFFRWVVTDEFLRLFGGKV